MSNKIHSSSLEREITDLVPPFSDSNNSNSASNQEEVIDIDQHDPRNESSSINTYPENSFEIPFSRQSDQSYTIRPEIDQQHVINNLCKDDSSNNLNADQSYENQCAQEQLELTQPTVVVIDQTIKETNVNYASNTIQNATRDTNINDATLNINDTTSNIADSNNQNTTQNATLNIAASNISQDTTNSNITASNESQNNTQDTASNITNSNDQNTAQDTTSSVIVSGASQNNIQDAALETTAINASQNTIEGIDINDANSNTTAINASQNTQDTTLDITTSNTNQIITQDIIEDTHFQTNNQDVNEDTVSNKQNFISQPLSSVEVTDLTANENEDVDITLTESNEIKSKPTLQPKKRRGRPAKAKKADGATTTDKKTTQRKTRVKKLLNNDENESHNNLNSPPQKRRKTKATKGKLTILKTDIQGQSSTAKEPENVTVVDLEPMEIEESKSMIVEDPKSTIIENPEPMEIESSESVKATIDVGKSSVPLRRTSRRVVKKSLYDFDVHEDDKEYYKKKTSPKTPRSNKRKAPIKSASAQNNDELEGEQLSKPKNPRQRKAPLKSDEIEKEDAITKEVKETEIANPLQNVDSISDTNKATESAQSERKVTGKQFKKTRQPTRKSKGKEKVDSKSLDYLLHNRNSFLTDGSIKKQFATWVESLNESEKKRLASLLPEPDLDSGKWSNKFMNNIHFSDSFGKWQDILYLGGFEQQQENEGEEEQKYGFKDDNYESYWGEKWMGKK